MSCCLGFLLVSPAVLTLLAQAPEPGQAERDTVIRITVDLVQIDAVVTDSKGRHVPDLRPEDFEILQDGRRQKITAFSYIRTQPAAAASAARQALKERSGAAAPRPLRPEQVRRTMALVVDDLGLSFSSMHDVRRSLGKFLDQQMQPGDLVAILRTAGGIGSLEQFTSDRRVLQAAVDRLRWYPGRGGIGAFPELSSDLLGDPSGPRGGRSPDAARYEQAALREEMLTLGTLGALRYVVDGLQEMPGRKSVILFSDGFSMWVQDENRPRLQEAFRKLVDRANRSSVVLYAIDARGLQTLLPDASEATPGEEEGRKVRQETGFLYSQMDMANLASETGGFAVLNTNDMNWGIGRVLEDQAGYYLLGYKPGESTFRSEKQLPEFHRIAVKVRVPGLRVRSRTGFYGVPTEAAGPAAKSPEEQLAAALRSPFGASDIRLKLTPLFANHAQGGSVIRNLLHLDARDLSFSAGDGERVGRLDIAGVVHGESGQVADRFGAAELRVREEDFEATLGKGLLYEFDLHAAKPGAYQLRIAVRDSASGRIGAASQFVEIPDVQKGRFALSGILLSAESEAGSPTEEDTVLGQSAVRLFRPGQPLSFVFQIYNPPAAQVEAAVLLWRDGRPVFRGEPAPVKPADSSDPKRLLATGTLRLGGGIASGAYMMQIVATAAGAKKKASATQWIDFEVAQ